MRAKRPGRLVILCGPSCVGKSPLVRALSRYYPTLTQSMQPVVLYNSRSPRPGEEDGKDYLFRSRKQVAALREDNEHIVMQVHGDLQAIDLKKLSRSLETENALFEGNPFVGRALQTHSRLKGVEKLTMFLSPISREEILYLREQPNVSFPDLVCNIMRRKLLRRAQKHNPASSLEDLENIEKRATSAYLELKEACHFNHVLPNHDGEDSDNWEAFQYPLGDARKALLAVSAILQGYTPPYVERWEESLL